MQKKFDITLYPTLSSIIDNIEANIQCPKFRENNESIEIDIWQNIKDKMPHNKNTADNGFGFCISNYYELGEFKRIIIINIDNCNQLGLTENEVSAIIYHELGHLLNYPQLTVEPTMVHCMLNGVNYDRKLHDQIKTENAIKEETFADSYANQYGYGKELISTFEKHNCNFEEKIGYYEPRLHSVKLNERLEGRVKEIDRNGW